MRIIIGDYVSFVGILKNPQFPSDNFLGDFRDFWT